MAELKTKKTTQSVDDFIAGLSPEKKRSEAAAMLQLMREATGEEPAMWGPSIVGFGHYHYKYATGREGDWFLCGFSPRKQNLALYIMSGFGRHEELLKKLGKYTTSVSCLYIKKLEDVNTRVLGDLIRASVAQLRSRA